MALRLNPLTFCLLTSQNDAAEQALSREQNEWCYLRTMHGEIPQNTDTVEILKLDDPDSTSVTIGLDFRQGSLKNPFSGVVFGSASKLCDVNLDDGVLNGVDSMHFIIKLDSFLNGLTPIVTIECCSRCGLELDTEHLNKGDGKVLDVRRPSLLKIGSLEFSVKVHQPRADLKTLYAQEWSAIRRKMRADAHALSSYETVFIGRYLPRPSPAQGFAVPIAYNPIRQLCSANDLMFALGFGLHEFSLYLKQVPSVRDKAEEHDLDIPIQAAIMISNLAQAEYGMVLARAVSNLPNPVGATAGVLQVNYSRWSTIGFLKPTSTRTTTASWTLERESCQTSGRNLVAKEARPVLSTGSADNLRWAYRNISMDLIHPNVALIVSVAGTAKEVQVLMEDVEWGSLENLIPRRIFTELECRDVAWQLLSVLVMLKHKNIVHGNIGSDHVLVASFEPVAVKLIGFSSMVRVDAYPGVRPARRGNLPGLLAPERASERQVEDAFFGEPNADLAAKIDVWSVGVVVYHTLTGYLPFPSAMFTDDGAMNYDKPWENRVMRLSEECRDILRKMLEVDPSVRSDATTLMSHPWFLRTAERATTEPEA